MSITPSNISKLCAELGLSKCAGDYASALFSAKLAEPSCNPQAQYSFPSQRVKVWATGDFVSGTVVGFVLVRPGYGACNNSPAANTQYVTYSSSASLFVTSTFSDTTATAGVSGTGSNSNYSSTAFTDSATGGASLLWRHVSTELEIWDTTPWSNRGGFMVMCCTPDHETLSGCGVANTAAFLSGKTYSFGGPGSADYQDCYRLHWNGPRVPNDLEYFPNFSLGTGSLTVPCMGAIISSNVNFTGRFRVSSQFEFVGQAARGKQDAWSDVQGGSLVASAASTANTSMVAGERGWFDAFKDSLRKGVEHALPRIGRHLATYGPGMALREGPALAARILGPELKMLTAKPAASQRAIQAKTKKTRKGS